MILSFPPTDIPAEAVKRITTESQIHFNRARLHVCKPFVVRGLQIGQSIYFTGNGAVGGVFDHPDGVDIGKVDGHAGALISLDIFNSDTNAQREFQGMMVIDYVEPEPTVRTWLVSVSTSGEISVKSARTE